MNVSVYGWCVECGEWVGECCMKGVLSVWVWQYGYVSVAWASGVWRCDGVNGASVGVGMGRVDL